jgi:hypothetical protein
MFVHDLRQSIGIVLLAAETLSRCLEQGSPEEIEFLKTIDNAGKRTMQLLTDFGEHFEDEADSPIGDPPKGIDL